MSLAVGVRLGPYEILSPLGSGGMGEVYRALDPRLGREVAIKVLPEPVAADPDRLRRFEQETRVVGALNHPHILTVYDVGRQDGAPYIVTELLEGETLREVILSRTPTARQIAAWGLQAARALSAAHRKGVVGRAASDSKESLRLKWLESLTNLRAGPQRPFPGWAKIPEWEP